MSLDSAPQSDVGQPRQQRRSDLRIKYIIPFPFDEEGIANRAAQIPHDILGPDTVVECVPVRNSITNLDSYYEATLLDAYITEAGLLSEQEGYDAVCMDTVSDSGLYALRSQLSIPVIGPGLVSYCVASMLAKKFTIITMWDKCASVHTVNEEPNQKNLLAGKEERVYARLVEEAQKRSTRTAPARSCSARRRCTRPSPTCSRASRCR